MDADKLYVFVEGSYDELFFNWYFKARCIKVIQYAAMEKPVLKGIVTTLFQQNKQLLFFKDSDGKSIEDRMSDVQAKYPFINDINVVFIVKHEIESWYFAGISREKARELKFSSYYEDTNTLTKEKFSNIQPEKLSTYIIISKMLENFDLQLAIERNLSLRNFTARHNR